MRGITLALFFSYIPTPLVLLADEHGQQAVYIGPKLTTIISNPNFKEVVPIWQKALPSNFHQFGPY